ncbi:hypothetical protein [Mycobacterium sp. PS03-16]|uniref:hypothetical protein n=1 Tax=Mycobacterium sp. PS03-16 TaxID=2559611 RepID=UPI001FD86ABA|nr:hypothetical protein [Mycobacterium sp. PS03-16]
MTAPDHPTATPFNRDTDPRAGREPMPHDAGPHDPNAAAMPGPGAPGGGAAGARLPDATTGPLAQPPMSGGPQTAAHGSGRPHGDDAGTDRPGGDAGTDRAGGDGGPAGGDDQLFHGADLSGMRSRWDDVQAAFVDDPRACVQKADALVSEVVDQLTRQFAEARSRLEGQWSRGEEASTEDLRIALKRYREFFQRLLSV